MPVRRSIHSSLTPSRAAITSLRTTIRGTLTPTDATAAVARDRPTGAGTVDG
jgi:hypothetical protein